MKYRFLEHTADAMVDAYGKTKEEAYANAGLALTSLMTDPKLVEPRITHKIKVKAEDDESLLYEFLNEILYLFETKGLVFSKYKTKIKGYELKCTASGEKFNPGKHEPENEVKAITYHQMSVKKKGDKWVARVVFDL